MNRQNLSSTNVCEGCSPLWTIHDSNKWYAVVLYRIKNVVIMPFNFSDTWSLTVMNCKPILSYTWASHLDIACITYKCFIHCMCVLIFLMSCAQKDTFSPSNSHIHLL